MKRYKRWYDQIKVPTKILKCKFCEHTETTINGLWFHVNGRHKREAFGITNHLVPVGEKLVILEKLVDYKPKLDIMHKVLQAKQQDA